MPRRQSLRDSAGRIPRRLRRVLRRAKRAVSAERLALSRRRPIDAETVLYESYAGSGMLCHPEAIFRHLHSAEEFSGLRHIWVLSTAGAVHRFRTEFEGDDRVSFVKRGSAAYWRAVSTAGYLINNSTFPAAFSKRQGQVYLNTWHGTPLKKMGYDMPNGAVESANTQRNMLSADFLLAANNHMTQVMYQDAYRLRNVFTGRIIEEGSPRIDRQMLSPADATALRSELDARGIRTGERRIVLFAPTWRGDSFSRATVDLDEMVSQVTGLQQGLGDDYVVLAKVHQSVHRMALGHPSLSHLLVPNDIPTNLMLGIASALVTDYSSIFFDFLASRRPIGFFIGSAEEYDAERGAYFATDELPGPVNANPQRLGTQLAALLDAEELYPDQASWAERFAPHEDGRATERIVDIVFRGEPSGYRVLPVESDGRRRLLLYLGGMRSNGITTSALNLLNAIDHREFDVTALMPYCLPRQAHALRQQLHPAVRQVFRIGGMNGLKLLQFRRRLSVLFPSIPQRQSIDALWADEWARIFGDARFDWTADYSGYSPLWANIVLQAPEAPHAIWLHNEMAADRRKVINGKKPKWRSLGSIFSLYPRFDQIVSVSPSLTERNRHDLATRDNHDAFMTVRNLPNAELILERAAVPLADILPEGQEPPAWFSALSRRREGEHWFVSVGRLSTEKNHARLVEAFARLHATRPETRLLIVGEGALEADLRAQIQREGLSDAAFLTGLLPNPFPVMRAADCFVLSSDHEGQPMVILEAALLGLPVISTAFASVEDALPSSKIHVVDASVSALHAGLVAYLNGDVPATHLDAAGYTAEVLADFASLLPRMKSTETP